MAPGVNQVTFKTPMFKDKPFMSSRPVSAPPLRFVPTRPDVTVPTLLRPHTPRDTIDKIIAQQNAERGDPGPPRPSARSVPSFAHQLGREERLRRFTPRTPTISMTDDLTIDEIRQTQVSGVRHVPTPSMAKSLPHRALHTAAVPHSDPPEGGVKDPAVRRVAGVNIERLVSRMQRMRASDRYYKSSVDVPVYDVKHRSHVRGPKFLHSAETVPRKKVEEEYKHIFYMGHGEFLQGRIKGSIRMDSQTWRQDRQPKVTTDFVTQRVGGSCMYSGIDKRIKQPLQFTLGLDRENRPLNAPPRSQPKDRLVYEVRHPDDAHIATVMLAKTLPRAQNQMTVREMQLKKKDTEADFYDTRKGLEMTHPRISRDILISPRSVRYPSPPSSSPEKKKGAIVNESIGEEGGTIT